MKIEIDVEQFARDMKAGKSICGKDGACKINCVNHLQPI